MHPSTCCNEQMVEATALHQQCRFYCLSQCGPDRTKVGEQKQEDLSWNATDLDIGWPINVGPTVGRSVRLQIEQTPNFFHERVDPFVRTVEVFANIRTENEEKRR